MLIENNFKIREAQPQEDNIIAEHFYQMWLDNNIAVNSIRSDWLNITLDFITKARQKLAYKAFMAEIDNTVVGSVSCQFFDGLYPLILAESYRKYGYVWGVYVVPSQRGQGIATQLTNTACNYLKSIGCTRATLHASPLGKPVYERLGFLMANEMRLDFSWDY